MTGLILIKERLINFYSRCEAFIVPILKFILAFVVLSLINSDIGFMSKIDNIAIVVIVALMCSFLPSNMIVVFSALFVALHLYSLSLECAVVVVMIFLIMFVFYFRFSPKDAVAVLLIPICFKLKIPYVVPIALGFVGTPLSCVSAVCGVVSYYMLGYVKENSDSLTSNLADPEAALSSFKYIIDGLLGSDEMLLMAITFAVVVVTIFLIKSLPVDYSWKVALGVGAVVNILILLVGSSALEVDLSIGGVILSTIVSTLLALVLQFFVFNVDYSRTENVQFEDDEYYYYVKAVPKVTVEEPSVEVKRINPQRR